MNASRFFPGRLCRAFDGENCSCGSGREITRRSFLKRTGGATVATLVAWNLASQDLKAQGEVPSDSDSFMVMGTPAGGYNQSGWVSLSFYGRTYRAKVETSCSPASGEGKIVAVSANGAGWWDGASDVIKTGTIALAGAVSGAHFATALEGGPQQSATLWYYEARNLFGDLLQIYDVKVFAEVTADVEVSGDYREVDVRVRIVGKIDVYSPPGVFDKTLLYNSGDVVQKLKVKKIPS